MAENQKRWTVRDRYGNSIYLTEERWKHITDILNHPEMEDYEEYLKNTIQVGRRNQEPLNPRKYRYQEFFENLPDYSNSVVAIVIFGFDIKKDGTASPNNFVATAFLKHIMVKGKKWSQ